ncbi:MAG: arginine--tRNA ligase [Christensenellaceae bacterium]|nr:arginine--tRNA ligase [Christensenellaceae bacterium]
MDFKDILLTALESAVSEASGLTKQQLSDMLETPPNPEMGDFALPCFKLARSMRKAPPAIASELRDRLGDLEGFSRIEAAGGYLNFFTDKSAYARTVIVRALTEGDAYGSSDEGRGKNVCVEYSSINIAKPFGIHHITTTVLGNSLKRIYDHLGYHTISINHLGDWGTQFGKMVVAYNKWGDRERIENGDSMRELVALYVKFHEEAEKDPSLEDEARAAFHRIEMHEPEEWALFQWFKDVTLKDVARVYDMLGITFDSYNGESFYEDKMPAIIKELADKGISKLDKGMTIVDLSDYDMPPCIILKSDGSTIYATRDIAAAKYRKETYDFYKSLYVVAYQQNLHFRQFFKVLELMGYEWAKDCVHVNFGMISMEDMTFSTRKGNAIYLEDVLNAAIEKTLEIIKVKSPNLENKEEVARKVGIGALVFSVLYNGRIKDYTFSWDKSLNFDGETGPYAQYTYARSCSVLRKAAELYGEAETDIENIDFSVLCDPASAALLRAIDALPETIKQAAEKYEPYLISRGVIEICSCFNKFYYDNRIMDDDPAVSNARLALTKAASIAIRTGLFLVGLEAPEKM